MTPTEVRWLDANTAVQCSNIIGSDLYVYSAWVRMPERGFTHSSIRHLLGDVKGRFGQVGFELLPKQLEYSLRERPDARDRRTEWRAARYDVAHALIVRAFPETARGQRRLAMLELYPEGPHLPTQRVQTRDGGVCMVHVLDMIAREVVSTTRAAFSIDELLPVATRLSHGDGVLFEHQTYTTRRDENEMAAALWKRFTGD